MAACVVIGALHADEGPCTAKMTTLFQNCGVLAHIAGYHCSSLSRSLRMRRVNRACCEVVDDYVPRVWLSVLDERILAKAFSSRTLNVYIIEQSLKVRGWLQRQNILGVGGPLREFPFVRVIPDVYGQLPRVFEWIEKYGIVNMLDGGGFLLNMVRRQPNGVRRLLEVDGIDVNIAGNVDDDFVVKIIDIARTRIGPSAIDIAVGDIRIAIRKGYKNINSAFKAACGCGMFDAIPALVDAGADVNARIVYDDVMMSALAVVIKEAIVDSNCSLRDPRVRALNAVQSMLSKGANANDPDISLDDIARSQMQNLMRPLLTHGANPNKTGAAGRTALFYASVDVLRLLLATPGIAIDHVDDTGNTALMYNVYDYEKARLLVEAGANINVQNVDGKTALMIALEAQLRRSDVIRMLLDRNADIDLCDIHGRTTLMYAASFSEEFVSAILIRSNWRATSKVGRGVLYYVKSPKALEVIAGFVGAEMATLINQRDKNGSTPLSYVVSNAFFNKHLDPRQEPARALAGVIRGLLLLGADAGIPDRTGFSVLRLQTGGSEYKEFIKGAIDETIAAIKAKTA